MIIYLDMDGTIADLYSVPNWLDYIEHDNTFPYRKAKLLLNQDEINWLNNWIKCGNDIAVISWLSKRGNHKYNKAVRAAKIRWLKKNLPLPYASIHIVKYGTPKSKFNCKNNILIDDDERNLIDWQRNGGIALSPQDFKEIVKNDNDIERGK